MKKDKIPTYLNKIKSDKKAIECSAIFNEQTPTPSELLWLLKFLKFAGYSKQELQEIMNTHAQWSEYSGSNATHIIETVFQHFPID